MNHKKPAAVSGQTLEPTDKTELNSADLEQVSGGILIALLLPAVQKVREGTVAASGDPHIIQKGK